MGLFHSSEKHPTELEYYTNKSIQHLEHGRMLLQNRKKYDIIEGFSPSDTPQGVIEYLEKLHNALETEMHDLSRYQQEYHKVLENYQQRIANQYSGNHDRPFQFVLSHN